jgi:hypothetical protein
MRKYLVPSSDIQKEVADYVAINFPPGRNLGVHYRGTDKGIEAAVVSCEQMIETVMQEVEKQIFSTVFVASDEVAFIEELKASMPTSVRLVFRDHERSVNGRAIHHKESENVGLQRAREAMIDSLLLGHVTLLVKTPSMLSGWAKVHRPDLPLILVGKLRPQARLFPDKLWEEGFNE